MFKYFAGDCIVKPIKASKHCSVLRDRNGELQMILAALSIKILIF